MADHETNQRPIRRRSRIAGQVQIDQILGLVAGISSLIGAIFIALVFQEKLQGPAQYSVQLLAALGVALACMALTGFVEIQGRLLPFQVRAGGAVAIFIAVLFVPAQLWTSVIPSRDPWPVPREEPSAAAMRLIDLYEAQDWATLNEAFDPRCIQGGKLEVLPPAQLAWPRKVGKPTQRVVNQIMNGSFSPPPGDPVRFVEFIEERAAGESRTIVKLVAQGPREASVWAPCSIEYASQMK
jgi:hypothetical protein